METKKCGCEGKIEEGVQREGGQGPGMLAFRIWKRLGHGSSLEPPGGSVLPTPGLQPGETRCQTSDLQNLKIRNVRCFKPHLWGKPWGGSLACGPASLSSRGRAPGCGSILPLLVRSRHSLEVGTDRTRQEPISG